MRRICTLLVVLSSLTACGAPYAPIKLGAPPPPDLPDAALVVPCDTAEGDPATVGQLADELTHTRKQRDDCAARMGGVASWRAGAIKRAATPAPAATTP